MPIAISILLLGVVAIYFYNSKVNNNDSDILENMREIGSGNSDLYKSACDISVNHGVIMKKNSRKKLIKSLDRSYKDILRGYEYIDRDVRNKKEVVPAAEWLLDNLYLIEKEYKDIKHNMPYSYYKDLPALHEGLMKGYPRIYHIALEIVSKTDGKVDEGVLKNFTQVYQNNTVLTTGELWALPIMVRVALIQSISQVIEKMVFAQKEKNRANSFSEEILEAVTNKSIEKFLQKYSERDIRFTSHFTERLLKILRDNGVDNFEIYKWIDEKLDAQGFSSEKLINIEHNKQAAFQISMGNCISGIREVEALNWRECFDSLSVLENILREDPANIYENMEFESRDYYRHKIEKISKENKLAEIFIGRKAIQCALSAFEERGVCMEAHVGYYLIDDGIKDLNRKIGIKEKGFKKLKLFFSKNKVFLYIFSIVFLTLLLMASIIFLSLKHDSNIRIGRYIVALIVIIIPCSEIVISIFNWSVNHLTKPRIIPKLAFKEGIPKECRTVVVIPTILNNTEKVKDLVSQMEVYYLSNCYDNIYFALLGDYKDSSAREEYDDKAIANCGLRCIKELNEKYASNGNDIFYFFCRYRKFNEKENNWMGYERKRGKLMEFNALLRGKEEHSYNIISGDLSNLREAKYVITLDADTYLPRDTAKRLIGSMAHILNIPEVKDGKVLRGYGIMQPRINVSTLSGNKSLFSRIFSGETGIDTYTTAVSDLYQDLFGEGIFTGKGIYDIDVFLQVIEGEIPENSVLSHDLLEGSYARCALVSDLELVDGYPWNYIASTKRLHRWVRGDWQLLPWINHKNKLNRLSKWKMIDNLRRSLLTPSIVILVFLSYVILPNGMDKWLITAALALMCPVLFSVSDMVASPMRDVRINNILNNNKVAVEQVFLLFCFLPYTAYIMMDAVIRTLYRVCISKKNMLKWQTAADVDATVGNNKKSFIKNMWQGSVISLIILFAAFSKSLSNGLFILPSCIIWFFSPLIASYISKDRGSKRQVLTEDTAIELRKISRRTWSYFEDFVNEDSNYLSPDNYQEEPQNGIAKRTSPTNMAMGLITNIVAYDMGYIDICEALDRIEKSLDSMSKLEKFKGHFYNWYDTETMQPLKPKYISTVDSGNFVGYLWVISSAIKEIMHKPLINMEIIKGVNDLLYLCKDDKEKFTKILEFSEEMDGAVLIELLKDIGKECGTGYWNIKLKNTCDTMVKNILYIFPWLDMNLESIKDISYIPIKNSLLNLNVEMEYAEKGVNKAELAYALRQSGHRVKKLIEKMNNIVSRLESMADETDFRILYDKKRQLFSIGYDIEKDTIGNCYYDLLASEARQASFVAIAKGDVEQKHWFKLGRAMTKVYRNKGLVSWSGTMFEYLMPLLIMKNYPNTLLNETYYSIIEGQKKYAKDRGVPFGISESAFNSFDMALNYQYKAFGVPQIGLKRGLMNELVIAPYATILALQYDLQDGYKNIEKLISEGLMGRYGFYEAIDYTKSRLPKGKKKAVVKCFMVHHEGMSLMALDNVLKDNILQKRFSKVPRVKATELLLQEKVPKKVIYDRQEQTEVGELNIERGSVLLRSYNGCPREAPETLLLSNGLYSVMITNTGSGYSKKEDMLICRWKEDVTEEYGGMYFYIKDLNTHNYWSATYNPCKMEANNYKATFSLDKAEFKRKDNNLLTHTEVVVSNEDNAEVRRISITNHSDETKVIEITSFSEVTLTEYMSDIVHPAFSNLFIRTEYVESPNCIICSRRPRTKGHNNYWAMQTIAVEGDTVGSLQFETSRANFIGRNRTLQNPQAMEFDAPLKNTVGAVLDPIISIRKRVRIKPSQTCKIAYTTAVGDSREEVLDLAKKYSEMHNVKRIFELAWTQSEVEMKYLGIKSFQANLYQLISSKLIFLNSSYREREDYIKNIKVGQSSLWPYGISGDLPIVLLLVYKDNDIELVRQLLNAHEYLTIKGLKVDLVIMCCQNTSYLQNLTDSIRDIISGSHARDKINKKGGVFLFNSSSIKEEVINLLKGSARLLIDGKKGLLVTQVKGSPKAIEHSNTIKKKSIKYNYSRSCYPKRELLFFNDIGGFDINNNSYVMTLKDYKNTPAPWINVISNRNFGFNVSESGSSYTWYKNSRENKITPWNNDPISDPLGECLYLRDEDTGDYWSITPKPIRDEGEYLVQHGFGYTIFSHMAFGIDGEVTMFVPKDISSKVYIIKLKNICDIDRSISLSYFARMTLGVASEETYQYIYTGINENKKYIFAENPHSEHFNHCYAYLYIFGGESETFTGDRSEFIGRGGTVQNPQALTKENFSNTCGAGMDPCLAENVKLSLKVGEERELILILGEEDSIQNAENNIDYFSSLKEAKHELQRVKEMWEKLIGTIKVKTPDESMNIMLNGWLMYQTLSCRIWSRTAFYQSGGAYGFRDQLQDSLALCYIKPELTKLQIIQSSFRQYLEGDVQHWWHPTVDSGIRTRFSDDLLWLPYVTAKYIEFTGDYSILSVETNFLYDEPLKEGEDEKYEISRKSDIKGSIYVHCIKAIEKSLSFGEHNLPLMGCGDWNDGMNTVGNKGKGESVWLGWFLYSILDSFKDICLHQNEEELSKKYQEKMKFIKENLEKNAWDGNWYKRAYFDDGTPLGSIEDDECQIDSIAQTWAVISGGGDSDRTKIALDSIEKYLVQEDKGMVKLFTPPFDKSNMEPGYIKGYLPGVRENGGQYTHAVTWLIMSFVKVLNGNKAFKIFNMINPINHTKSPIECEIYKVEPYVMAADVYAVEPHEGRGGWTWYTGAAGWMYRAGIEGILGLKFIEGKGFTIQPCIPDEWNGFSMVIRKNASIYNVNVTRGENKGIYVDGNLSEDKLVQFFYGGEHQVKVII